MRIAIVGASDHARVAIDVARAEGLHDVVGVVDRDLEAGSDFCGHPVFGPDAALADAVRRHDIEGCFIAIGDNWTRARLAAHTLRESPSLALATLVHPAATVAPDSVIADGAVVMAGAVVNPGCELGELAIVNTGASLDHDSRLGRCASLAPGVVTGGRVEVGDFAAVGIGATLIHGVKVGEHTVVGAGALVLEDVPAQVVAFGSPAQVVRQREKGDPYL